MKKRGSLFVEVLISILIFLVGVLILMSAMTLSIRLISDSGNTIIADQDLINKVDNYMISRLFSHTDTPSGSVVEKISASPQNFNIGGFVLKYSQYRFKRSEKAVSYFDILQREK